MMMIRFGRSAALVAVTTLAVTSFAHAQAPKPAPAAPAAPPAAKPAAAAPTPAPAAAPAAKPAAAVPAAPAAKTAPPAAAAPATPPAAAAAAAPAAPPPMPTPSKELEAFMKGFEGSWKCETKFAAGAMGPGSPEVTSKSTVKFKKEFGGFLYRGEYNLPKSKTMPAMSGVFELGYDAGTNQVTVVGYDSFGSSNFGAGPITGDSVVLTEDGYMMGMKVKLRETMTKKAPKEASHKYEVDMGKGFQLMGEDTCKK